MTTKHPTHLVVDGSNIATEGRSTPSLKQLDEAVRAILEEFPHEHLTVVVDATFGHRIAESERAAYEEAILAGEIVAPPAGAIGRGDAFILQVAEKAGATVFSNDSFQEFHGEHEWLFDEGRLIGGKPVPGVGWVFVPRVPVRGPLSRRSVRESKRAKASQRKGSGEGRSRQASAAASQPLPKPATPPPAAKRKDRAPAVPAASEPAAAPASPAKADRGDTGTDEPAVATPRPPVNGAEALNEPTVFLSFIAQNRIGSVIEATVDHFSSHGAYVIAGGARCYLPTKTMGDPPPNRARDVISRGDTVRVEVQSLDAERRGINVRFVELVESTAVEQQQREQAYADHGDGEATPPELADEVLSIPAERPRSDTDVAMRKSAAKRAAVKRAPSGRPVEELAAAKATIKKAAAEATPSPRAVKAASRKAPAKKAASRRGATAEAPVQEELPAAAQPGVDAADGAATKATTRRATRKATAEGATEAATKKAATKKATAAKATAKKATAKKATTKSAAKKATATKATATKATAKKATTKKAAASKAASTTAAKATAKKAATKTATATKATAAKAAAKKAAAKKATTRKATTAKASATKATTRRTSRSAG